MTASRWSIKGVLRQVRGARNAAGRTEIRYGKHDAIALLLRVCMAKLTDAERALLDANRRAVAREDRRRAA